jgi:hypothetical protein
VPTGGLELITDFPGLRAPDWTVTRVLPNQSMGDFMQNNLLYFLQAAIFNQMPADCYSLRAKVTLASAINGSIKPKRIMNDAVLNEELSRSCADL